MWKWSLLAWVIAIGMVLFWIGPGRGVCVYLPLVFGCIAIGFGMMGIYIATCDQAAYKQRHSFIFMAVSVSFLWLACIIKDRETYLEYERELEKASQGRNVMIKILARIVAVFPFCFMMMLLFLMYLVVPFAWLRDIITDKKCKKS